MLNYAVEGNHKMNRKVCAKLVIKLLSHSIRIERISQITYTDVLYCLQSYKFTKKYDSDLLEESKLLLQYLCELHFHPAYFIPMSPTMMLGFKHQLLLR